MDFATIERESLNLPAEDRAKLAHELLESLDALTSQEIDALWMAEASSYDYATNSGNAGHYTQVVWRTSVRIGCAIVNCPAVAYNNTILCDYAPGGNIGGQKPY